MREINNLSHSATAPEAFMDFTQQLPRTWGGIVHCPYALIVFSGVVTRVVSDHASNRTDDYGQAFANYIAENGLGTVTGSDAGVNKNTQNHIKAWVWTVNREAVTKWAADHAPAPVQPTLVGATDDIRGTGVYLDRAVAINPNGDVYWGNPVPAGTGTIGNLSATGGGFFGSTDRPASGLNIGGIAPQIATSYARAVSNPSAPISDWLAPLDDLSGDLDDLFDEDDPDEEY